MSAISGIVRHPTFFFVLLVCRSLVLYNAVDPHGAQSPRQVFENPAGLLVPEGAGAGGGGQDFCYAAIGAEGLHLDLDLHLNHGFPC